MSRRLFAGLCAAGVAVLGLTAPARAAEPDGTVAVFLADTLLGVGANATLSPVLSADRELKIRKAALTYELSGDLPGVSLINPDEESCTSDSPTTITCSLGSTIDLDPEGGTGYGEVDLSAAESAVPGSTGSVTATLTAKGITPVSTTAAVQVLESVDLAAGEGSEISADPGATFTARLEATNLSSTTIDGLGVYFATPPAFEPAERYRNCLYAGDQLRGCLFDQSLEPAATAQLAMPYRLRNDTLAPSSVGGQFQWLTAAEYDAVIEKMSAGGTEFSSDPNGATLSLTPKPAAKRAAAAQTDVDPSNNWQYLFVNVTGTQSTDIAALGTTVSGAAGATVQATVGVRNNGPASLDRSGVGDPATVAHVTVPADSTVTTVPNGCSPVDEFDPRLGYLCQTGLRFRVGESVTWTFGVRIDKVMPGAIGTVEANPKCECGNFAKDLDLANNKAELVLNPVEAPAPSTPATGSPATDAPATGQPTPPTPSASASAPAAVVDTGSVATPRAAAPRAAGVLAVSGVRSALPNTGPDGMAVLQAGALFVAAGVAMVWLTRRRTTAV
ncbi:LPXTG cell wall anchor domain-containing protein [Actinoplanes sp. NPDC051859]|uniref:LPXTG cell wall anchor domain-containing protein n=1 Tax=Actinoplanes sp. NPDC051859 TaxID=3363909 RepID=UPI00379402CE